MLCYLNWHHHEIETMSHHRKNNQALLDGVIFILTHRKNCGTTSHMYHTGSFDGFTRQLLSLPKLPLSRYGAQDEPRKLHVQKSDCPSRVASCFAKAPTNRPRLSPPPPHPTSLLGKLSIKSSCKSPIKRPPCLQPVS